MEKGSSKGACVQEVLEQQSKKKQSWETIDILFLWVNESLEERKENNQEAASKSKELIDGMTRGDSKNDWQLIKSH